MKKFPIVGFFKYYFYYPFIKKMQVISPLNYIGYSKKQAIATLGEIYGWQNYGEKHDESIWTRFFQSYFLMKKFGYDVRKPYYSSSILSGEITREEALCNLKPFSEEVLAKDLDIVLERLQLTKSQWQEIMETPKKDYTEYANNHKLYLLKQKYFNIFFPHSYFWVTD